MAEYYGYIKNYPSNYKTPSNIGTVYTLLDLEPCDESEVYDYY